MTTMVKKIIIPLLGLCLSCVTTNVELPKWVEIKPANTDRESYFVYGPVETQELAKKGLYKEISQYFGVNVSSVDKFVKAVTFENGERGVEQAKESQVDIVSRDKGLESIEIREIWSDGNNGHWCILASLDKSSEEKIRKQVEAEIEAERVAGILKQAEGFTRQTELLYDKIEEKSTELKKLELRMAQSIERVSQMSDSSEIMAQARNGLAIGESIAELLKEIKILTNEVKIVDKKNALLSNQLEGNEIALIELDLYTKGSSGIVIKTDEQSVGMLKLEEGINNYKETLNGLYLKSELDLLGDEESQKRRLIHQITAVSDSAIEIKKIENELELKHNQSKDLLLTIKQKANDDSLEDEEKSLTVQNILEELEVNFSEANAAVEAAYNIKSGVDLDLEGALKSNFISREESIDIKRSADSIKSPLSWIEIYKDKIMVLLKSARDEQEKMLVKQLIDIRLNTFTENMVGKVPKEDVLTIGEFTIADSDISSEFSNLLKSKLISLVGGSGNFKIVDYRSVTSFLNEKDVNPDMIYRGTSETTSIVQQVIYGDYWDKGQDIELKVYVKNIKDNTVLHSEAFIIPKESIPNGVSLTPENYNQVVSLNSKIDSSPEIKGVQIWPDRGNGSTYTEGDQMIVHVASDKTGYIKIYHISSENEMTLIYPNKFDTDNSIIGGEKYTVGDGSYPFKFMLGKPYGTESLRVLFSTTQFNDLLDSSYENRYIYEGIRGVNIENQIKMDLKGESIMATSFYTITE